MLTLKYLSVHALACYNSVDYLGAQNNLKIKDGYLKCSPIEVGMGFNRKCMAISAERFVIREVVLVIVLVLS